METRVMPRIRALESSLAERKAWENVFKQEVETVSRSAAAPLSHEQIMKIAEENISDAKVEELILGTKDKPTNFPCLSKLRYASVRFSFLL